MRAFLMTRKTLAYSSLAVLSIIVVIAFVTAKNYVQLGFAVAVYPFFMYFVYKVFLGENHAVTTANARVPQITTVPKNDDEHFNKVEVADVDKRTFLKIIGTAGLSFFVFSLLGRRVESLFFGKAVDPGTGTLGGTLQGTSTKESMEEYKISEIDDSTDVAYYGFVNKDGAWFIMKEDLGASTYRYARGNSGFSDNWQNRRDLKYDYYFNLF